MEKGDSFEFKVSKKTRRGFLTRMTVQTEARHTPLGGALVFHLYNYFYNPKNKKQYISKVIQRLEKPKIKSCRMVLTEKAIKTFDNFKNI